MIDYQSDLISKNSLFLEKYRSRNEDGSLSGGFSAAKIFANGGSMTRITARLAEDNSPKAAPPPPEDRKKLSGILTLADLNQHLSDAGNGRILSENDVNVLTDRMNEDFSTYKTDPEMNIRRNRYMIFMAEMFIPGTQR